MPPFFAVKYTQGFFYWEALFHRSALSVVIHFAFQGYLNKCVYILFSSKQFRITFKYTCESDGEYTLYFFVVLNFDTPQLNSGCH